MFLSTNFKSDFFTRVVIQDIFNTYFFCPKNQSDFFLSVFYYIRFLTENFFNSLCFKIFLLIRFLKKKKQIFIA